jgi:hypothetical protein
MISSELPFRIPDDPEFVRGMRLTQAEVDALDRYIGIIEQAAKNPVDFARSDAVAFTPGALLVVAVARFAYQVYCDYGKAAVTPQDIQFQWKEIAKELAEIESGGLDAVGLDTYAKLRRGLVASRRSPQLARSEERVVSHE